MEAIRYALSRSFDSRPTLPITRLHKPTLSTQNIPCNFDLEIESQEHPERAKLLGRTNSGICEMATKEQVGGLLRLRIQIGCSLDRKAVKQHINTTRDEHACTSEQEVHGSLSRILLDSLFIAQFGSCRIISRSLERHDARREGDTKIASD
jgi:hypothetical protein